MNNINVIKILKTRELEWRRMNNQPCISTFYKDYYINLCLWHKSGVKTISIDIDDVKNNLADIVSEDLIKDNKYFESLIGIYLKAEKGANNIVAA